MKPPTERRVQEIIWKLKKTVYGLDDASRGFDLNISGDLVKVGYRKSHLDPAMLIYFN